MWYHCSFCTLHLCFDSPYELSKILQVSYIVAAKQNKTKQKTPGTQGKKYTAILHTKMSYKICKFVRKALHPKLFLEAIASLQASSLSSSFLRGAKRQVTSYCGSRPLLDIWKSRFLKITIPKNPLQMLSCFSKHGVKKSRSCLEGTL